MAAIKMLKSLVVLKWHPIMVFFFFFPFFSDLFYATYYCTIYPIYAICLQVELESCRVMFTTRIIEFYDYDNYTI